MAGHGGEMGGNKDAAAQVRALLRRVCAPEGGGAGAKAGVDGEAALRELQQVLLEPAALAGRGAGGIEGAIARMSQRRLLTVSVIVSSREANIVDSGDSAVRRLCGARAAERADKVVRSAWFIALFLGTTVICAVSFPLAFLGKINSGAALAVLAIQFGMLLSAALTIVSLPLLRLLAKRFEPYFIFGHALVAGVSGFVMYEDQATAWLLLLTFVLLYPLSLAIDANAARSKGKLAYLATLVAMLGVLAGLYSGSFPLRPATFVVLAETLPVKDRLAASLFCCCLYTARFVVTLYQSSGGFVFLKGSRIGKCNENAARALIAKHSVESRVLRSARWRASAAAAPAAPAASVLIPRAEGAAPSQGQGQGQGQRERQGGASGLDAATTLAFAPAPAPATSPDALESAAMAARAALGASGGDDAAARKMLLHALEELIEERKHRKNTMLVKQELLAAWGADASDRRGAGGIVHVVLPCFAPLVVDPNRSVAAALGGERLNRASYAVCRSKPFMLAFGPLSLFAYVLGVYAMCSEHDWLLTAWAPIQVVVILLNLWQTLLLNTVVIREVVLRSWDLFFSLGNMFVVAATGAWVFINPNKGMAWCIFQLSGTFFFFHDAAPPNRSARRLIGLMVATYAAFQLLGVFFMLSRVFPLKDVIINVAGVLVNVKYTCIACQLNAAILTLRFAWRALRDHKKLVFVDGLARVTMLLSDATELRAHAIAGDELARKSHTSVIPIMVAG